jgi:hypothetical protein
VTHAQRDQLLLYVALVKELRGGACAASIHYINGEVRCVEFDDEAVQEVVARAETALSSLRSAAGGASELQAIPAESACGLCPYRVVCRTFLEGYERGWAGGHVRLAKVLGVGSGEDAELVEATVLLPSWAEGAVRLVGFTSLADLSAGDVIGFSDFEGPAQTAFARWNTLLAKWDGSSSSDKLG